MRLRVVLAVSLIAAVVTCTAAEPPLRHSRNWVQFRMASMLAVDDAYIWHEVLGGRAIHQNSRSNPPTEPNEGNFHTQQQSQFALVKMEIATLSGDERHLDDARDLLQWVVTNGYDADQRQFYLNWNTHTEQWKTNSFPGFNMINVAGLLAYNSIRPTPEFAEAAENVLGRILEDATFQPEASKSLYESSYVALKLLDTWDTTGEERFLNYAQTVVDLANAAMWDEEFGGWFYAGKLGAGPPRLTVKHTHTNANMIQACFRLALAGRGDAYGDHAVEALEQLAAHSRSPEGGWYRHNTRDWSDPTAPPMVGDGEASGTGAVCVYDRMAQVMVGCALGYRVTGDARYLQWIDETLDYMEQAILTHYPAGVNYGYIVAGDYQNTWCHLWGLKAMLAIDALWRDFGQAPRRAP